MSPMRWKPYRIALLALFLVLGSRTAAAAPTITTLSPTSGAVGASVTIAGSGFGSTQGSSTVKFNGKTATITSWSATSIVAKAPTGATTGNVVVTVSGIASNGKSFTVLPTPSISSLSPTSGAVGASVTIAGSNFDAAQGSGTVKFNGSTATVTSWSASSIVATIPSGATTGNVVVNASGVNSNGKSFTVVATPSVTSLTPTSGAVGASVTIAGSNFGATQGSSTVRFNGTTAIVTSWSATSVAVTVPTAATTGNVVVHASGVDSNGVNFTVLPTPNITSLSPTSGAVGALVTITGTNFGSSQGTSTVKFNGTTATATSWSATSVVVTVPSGATTGSVVVTVSGVASNGLSFTVVAAPSITSLSPISASVGTSVSITGANFGATQGTSAVKFNGTTATPTSWSATSIAAPVPTGATTGNVVVSVGGVASNGVSFTVTPPDTTPPTVPSGLAARIVSSTEVDLAWAASTDDVGVTGYQVARCQGKTCITFAQIGTPTGTTFNDTTVMPSTFYSYHVRAADAAGNLSRYSNPVSATTGPDTTPPTNPSGLNTTATVGQINLSWTASTDNVGVTGYDVERCQGACTTFAQIGTTTGTTYSDATVAPSVFFSYRVRATDLAGNLSGYSNTSGATAIAPTPTISSLTPNAGAIGDTILVSGSNFGPGGTVTFNGITATTTNWSTTSIFAIVPQGATSGNVVVTITGASSSGTAFTVSPPRLVSISVTPGNPAVAKGATQQFAATGTYTDGAVRDMSATATWSSSAASVATVSSAGLVTGVAFGQTTVQAAVGTISGSVSLTVDAPSFVLTGSLNTPRDLHTATLLNNGKVLIAGGSESGIGDLASAELYDPATGTFTLTGSLTAPRTQHTATLLNNGKVLIAGGYHNGFLATAELYDPATGTFTVTGSLNLTRYQHTATLLNNGKVLIVGGNSNASAELYDPATGTSTVTGSLNTNRSNHTAVLLNTGMVFVVGGADLNGNGLASAELFNPTNGTFTATGSLNAARIKHTAILLSNGMVLVAGGEADFQGTSPLTSAELYNPSSGTFTLTGPLSTARFGHTATLLNSGLTLIAGGTNTNGLSSAELYYPATGIFALTGAMNVVHVAHTASLLNNGMVLIAGGAPGISAAELYQATTSTTPPTLASIAMSPLKPAVIAGAAQQFTATGSFSDGTAQDITGKAAWVSSASGVATINSAGLATSVSPGTTTITATSGGLNASTTLTVAPLTLVYIALSPGNTSIALGTTQQYSVIGTYSDGSTRDLTSSVTWNSSSPSAATINSVGFASSVNVGGTTIQASLGSVNASASLYVDYPLLQSLQVLPASPQIATGGNLQFAVTGNYTNGPRDLTAQSVLSSSNISVATIGANGFVTGVASGATTITARFGSFTAQANLTVTTAIAPPRITASVFPAPNAAGWNNSITTVTFTCAPGGRAIASCTGPQTLSTEGANQVVSGTATDTAGTATSTNVTLNIDRTPPAVAVTSPADGATFSSSGVVLTGTVSDALSGLSGMTCNGTAATFNGGNFSCNISLNVGVNLVAVRASDLAGNIATVIFHETLGGILPAPRSLQIAPAGTNLLVGQTQQFNAVDDLGRPRSDATWMVSNTSIATISPDSMPSLTAVSVGQVTLTATVQSISAQVQVNILGGASLSPGTVLWSAPPVPGFTALKVVQATPATANTPDLYSVEVDSARATGNPGTNFIRAINADGSQMWQTQINGLISNVVPDAYGGVQVAVFFTGTDYFTFVDLDGQTGAQVWTAPPSNLAYLGSGLLAIRPDGAILGVGDLVTGYDTGDQTTVYMLDGKSGQPTFSLPIPLSSYVISNPDGSISNYDALPPRSAISVDSQGNAYMQYETFQETCTNFYGWSIGCLNSTTSFSNTLSLLKIAPDGSSSVQTLSTSSSAYIYPLQVIPDGQSGVLAAWWTLPLGSSNPGPVNITHVMTSGTTAYQLPLTIAQSPFGMVLGENGNGFATDGAKVVSFDLTSGQVQWSYTSPSLSIIASTAGNGLVAKTTDQNGIDTVLRFDSTGAVTPDTWTASGLDYFIGNTWLGSPSGGAATGYSAGTVQLSSAAWITPDQSGTRQAAQDVSVTNFSNAGPNQATITNVLQKIQTALPSYSSCNNWLQGGGKFTGRSGLKQVQDLLSTNFYGHGTVNLGATPDYNIIAFSASLNPDHTPIPGLPPPPAPIFTVNDISAFFNATDNQGHPFLVGKQKYPGNTLRAQLAALVHEVAHQITVNGFQDDFGTKEDQKAGRENDRLVDTYCRGLIEGPLIKSLTPSSGSVGAVVTITGLNFGNPQGASTITFNSGVAATPTSWSDTQIAVTVPAGATTGNIVVTVGGTGGQSASKNFTVQ
jgi:hypothetical protein